MKGLFSQNFNSIVIILQKINRDSLLNIFLRAITIIGKFCIAILILKNLPIKEYGEFGIISTTVSVVLSIIGLDFYTYNIREILQKNSDNLSNFITNQFFLHVVSYVIIIPIAYYILLNTSLISGQYIGLFLFLVISEHLSQELYRLLIALRRSVFANIILFIRSSSWVFLLYVLWSKDILNKGIQSILYLWMIGAFISVSLAFVYLFINQNIRFVKPVRLDWIIRGIKMSFPFLIGTILYKSIEFSARYFLDFWWTKEEVGIFTFFSGIANTIFIFVHASVIAILEPSLVETAKKGLVPFQRIYKKFKNQTILVALILFVLANIFIFPLLYIIDRSELFNFIDIFWILSLTNFIFCCSFIPHYGIYSFHKDKSILYSTLIAFTINILLNIILIPYFSMLGAAFSQLLTFFTLLLTKQWIWNKLKYQQHE